ncbi:stemmadenine O-acetyltransferase-like [Tripterygium wilfordii]|uniref:stemmadenine O-acetyltransferase-like n=1 Tax=Tripterygium wilfordii TaxID=458696 RepID=UPI0018F7F584|nr:stemmadenine O-acetyltransferase-like [Tripterygium wilfordii]
MEIEIISRECIKPSSPTPQHLRTHKISLIDQFSAPLLGSVLLLYPPISQATSISISKRSQLLKQSLSKTLTLYYPLAGRFIDNLSIDCNDEGLCYTVVRVNCDLQDFFNQTDICKILPKVPKLLPRGITFGDQITTGGNVVMIHENVFACGGFAISLLFSHNVFDASCLMAFLKTWTAMAQGGVAIPPDFSCSYLFPQNTAFPQNPMASTFSSAFGREGNFVFRRFFFEGSIVRNLKSKATSSGVHNPTRVEVVLALLFRCVMSALKAKHGAQKSVLMSTSVNLRSRAVPPLPATSVGSLVLTIPIVIGEETSLCSFIDRLRESVSTIDGEFLKSLQGAQGLQRFLEFVKETHEACSKALFNGAEFLVFNSWCNSGMYNLDFGWGKPIWFPCFGLPISGSVIQLMDDRMGNGIEACVTLEEEIMSMVEHDEELLSLASVDQNIPLQIDSLKSRL